MERLPAYAPELNPVEYLWSNLKGVALANFAGDSVIEVADTAERGSDGSVTTSSWPGRSWRTPA